MESIPRYIAGKHNPDTVVYPTPLLKPILDVTYGCMAKIFFIGITLH